MGRTGDKMEASLKRKILNQFDDEEMVNQMNRAVEDRGNMTSDYYSYENNEDLKKVKLDMDGERNSYFNRKEFIYVEETDSDADSEDIDLGDSDTDTSEDIKYGDNQA